MRVSYVSLCAAVGGASGQFLAVHPGVAPVTPLVQPAEVGIGISAPNFAAPGGVDGVVVPTHPGTLLGTPRYVVNDATRVSSRESMHALDSASVGFIAETQRAGISRSSGLTTLKPSTFGLQNALGVISILGVVLAVVGHRLWRKDAVVAQPDRQFEMQDVFASKFAVAACAGDTNIAASMEQRPSKLARAARGGEEAVPFKIRDRVGRMSSEVDTLSADSSPDLALREAAVDDAFPAGVMSAFSWRCVLASGILSMVTIGVVASVVSFSDAGQQWWQAFDQMNARGVLTWWGVALAFACGRGSAFVWRRSPEKKAKVHWLSDVLEKTHAAAALHTLTAAGLMDKLPLPDQPGLSAVELARACSLNSAEKLQGLLGLLADSQVLDRQHADSATPSFRHTARSQELREGGRDRNFVLVHISPAQVRPWWRIQEALSTEGCQLSDGKEPFRLEHGKGIFDFYALPENKDEALAFNGLMYELSEEVDRSLGSVKVGDYIAKLPIWERYAKEKSGYRKSGPRHPLVVDVGGGKGHVLRDVLSHNFVWNGVLFDLPNVVTDNELVSSDISSGRFTISGGDFLAEDGGIPTGADIYMLKWVLHDWSDSHCLTLLRNLRRAMLSAACTQESGAVKTNPRLLVLESIQPEKSSTELDDFGMWVIYGGKQRSVSQYLALLKLAGFERTKVTPFCSSHMIAIEAEASSTEQAFN